MRLVYRDTQAEVKIGDWVTIRGLAWEINHFAPPHKPSSSGKVTLRTKDQVYREFFVTVIGAVWIEREDRKDRPPITVLNSDGTREVFE